jgi:hypothetical protein
MTLMMYFRYAVAPILGISNSPKKAPQLDSHFTEDAKPRHYVKYQSSGQTFLNLNHNNLSNESVHGYVSVPTTVYPNNLQPNGLPILFSTVHLRLRPSSPSSSSSTTFRPFGVHLGSSTTAVGHNVAKSLGK